MNQLTSRRNNTSSEHRTAKKSVHPVTGTPFFGSERNFFHQSGSLQRKCKECEEAETHQRQVTEEEEELQRKETVQRQTVEEEEDLQMKTSSSPATDTGNRTNINSDLPKGLRSGIEALSGMDMSEVKVHKNSPDPARINALAYTRGQDIYIGSGQEKYLPHEAWHVVQQRQGRVKPDKMVNGEMVNTSKELEKEADLMGEKAAKLSGNHPRSEAGQTFSTQRKVSSTAIQRVAPVVFAGLTLPELATVLGSVAGTAAVVGSAANAKNNSTGKGAVMKLEFDGDYLLMPRGKAELENISRVLFLMEVERLYEARYGPDQEIDDDQKAELRQTAVGNVRQTVTRTMDSETSLKRGEFAANGEGGRTRETPWGAAKLRINGGWAHASDFNEDLYSEARDRGIELNGWQIDILKYCIVDYEYEAYIGIVSDDDIFVRGQDLNYYDDDGLIKIDCTVAFDWDGDTTYLEWKDGLAIRVGYDISRPSWVGASDPDD